MIETPLEYWNKDELIDLATRLNEENRQYGKIIRDFALEQGQYLKTEIQHLEKIEQLEADVMELDRVQKYIKHDDDCGDYCLIKGKCVCTCGLEDE